MAEQKPLASPLLLPVAAVPTIGDDVTMAGDDSTTESEYYDEGDDDDEIATYVKHEGNDALGGVSVQSSQVAVHMAVAPSPSQATDARASANHSTAFAHAAAVSNGSMQPVVGTKLEPTWRNALPVAVAAAVDIVKPHTAAAASHAPVAPVKFESSAATVSSPASIASSVPAAPLPCAPAPSHWQHPALSISRTAGYQSPAPPLNFSAPRPRAMRHDAIVSSASSSAAATDVKVSAEPTPVSASCTTCKTTLVAPLQVAATRPCTCCGHRYAPSRYPTLNQQDQSIDRRCDACYAAYLAKVGTPVFAHAAARPLKRSERPLAVTARRRPIASVDVPLTTHNPAQQSAVAATPVIPLAIAATGTSAAAGVTAVPAARVPRKPNGKPLVVTTRRQAALLAAAEAAALSAPPDAPPTPDAFDTFGTVAASTPSISTGTGTPIETPALAAAHPKCEKCKLRVYVNVVPDTNAAANLACRCCHLVLPKMLCFSKNQRSEGKHRCKACLGHVHNTSTGAVVQPTVKAKTKAKGLNEPTGLTAEQTGEREVAKYHEARRVLQRKRSANDLRGATRVEYEQQLDAEAARLKALATTLSRQYPLLMHPTKGLVVKAPRWSAAKEEARAARRAAKKKASLAKRVATKKTQQTATAAAAVMNAATRGNGQQPPDVIDMAGVATSPKASQKKAAAATAKSAKTKTTKPTAAAKRKATTLRADGAATDATPAAKKRRLQTADDDNDPWLKAQAEIAKGLSSLLGDTLGSIAGPSSAKAASTAPAMRTGVKREPRLRVDPSTYAPKTKLQAETPPSTTIVTRARKRTMQPVEIIDISD